MQAIIHHSRYVRNRRNEAFNKKYNGERKFTFAEHFNVALTSTYKQFYFKYIF